jgi:hypothetical protein
MGRARTTTRPPESLDGDLDRGYGCRFTRDGNYDPAALGAVLPEQLRRLSLYRCLRCGWGADDRAAGVHSASYRVRLDYRFEVAAISVTWLVLIAAPVLVTIALRRPEAAKTE